MAQLVEHVLGKDEVTGSNPVISSKKTLNAFALSVFFAQNKKRCAQLRTPFLFVPT